MLQASLGYYINPLMYVIVGVLFLKERLRRPQVDLRPACGRRRIVPDDQGRTIPGRCAVSLALLFTLYGVIRKQVAIGAMSGLFIETLLLFPFAMAWLRLADAVAAGGIRQRQRIASRCCSCSPGRSPSCRC